MALARLITDRAVDGVINQQQFHDLLLVGHRLGAIGMDHHAVRCRLLTGRHELRPWFEFVVVAGIRRPDFRQTNTTVGRDRETGVVAVMGNLDFVAKRDLEDGLTGLKVKRLAVDGDRGHIGFRAWQDGLKRLWMVSRGRFNGSRGTPES